MVKPGERYRHYKGKVVEVVAVARFMVAAVEGDVLKYSDNPFAIATVTDNIFPKEPVVIYMEVGTTTQWARPLRIFEEVLGETTMFYRFEKIA